MKKIIALWSSIACMLHAECMRPDFFLQKNRTKDQKEAKVQKRLVLYEKISPCLNGMSDESLSDLMKSERIVSKSYGINSIVTVQGTPVFFKKIPLTRTEIEHSYSTKNIFSLPVWCHYPLHFIVFNSWREVALHSLTTGLVLKKKYTHFPLMYHARIMQQKLPVSPRYNSQQKIKALHASWGQNSAVERMFQELIKSESYLVLCMEYIPYNVGEFLDHTFKQSPKEIDKTIEMIVGEYDALLTTLEKEKIYHFDGHVKNILTDGEDLFLTDFGHAISETFELSDDEKKILKHAHAYDVVEMYGNLLTYIAEKITKSYVHGRTLLKQYAQGLKQPALSPVLTDLYVKKAPYALLRESFFHSALIYPHTEFPLSEYKKIT